MALITGASSGFGRETAQRLAARGWRVFGTSRRERTSDITGCDMLLLDVRNDDSVRNCVEQMLARVGHIDVLVNNAGYVLNGFAEEATIAQVHTIFETNFFGMVRMTDAVLPIMRRCGAGRIINISSLAGLVGVPYRAFYAASKFAVEGYTESLHYEVTKFGIHVSLVEPGFFRTNLDTAMQENARTITQYDSFRRRLHSYFQKGVRHGGDPARVGRLVANIAEIRNPRLRYRVGADAVWLPRLKALLPQRWYSHGVRDKFKLH